MATRIPTLSNNQSNQHGNQNRQDMPQRDAPARDADGRFKADTKHHSGFDRDSASPDHNDHRSTSDRGGLTSAHR